MTFVNEPMMYSIALWIVSMAGAFLLFGNMSIFNRLVDGSQTDRSRRWAVFIALQVIMVVAAGIYVNTNSLDINTDRIGHEDEAEFVNKRYQQRRNTLMYFKWVFATLVLLGTQLYKAKAVNSLEARAATSLLNPKKEVQSYEQMSFHFNWDIVHYVCNSTPINFLISLHLSIDFTTLVIVTMHTYLFSDKGTSSTWLQWWELTASICGIFVMSLFGVMRSLRNASGSQSVFYSPEATVGHDQPAEDASIVDGNITIPTLRVLMVKNPSLAILVYSAVEIAYAMIFENDYGNAWVLIMMLVILPHMFTAMLRTHAAWYQFHLYAIVMYGNAFFLMPAINTCRGVVLGRDNNFIPSSLDAERHLMLPQEYANTDHMFRTAWTAGGYAHTALFQAGVAVLVVALSFSYVWQTVMLLAGFGGAGIVQVPSLAEQYFFRPMKSGKNNLMSILQGTENDKV